jgi:hypothetical protein
VRGFLVGSLLLIALEVFVTGAGPDKAAGLLGWSADAFDRVLSPDSPGIHQAKTRSTSSSSSSNSSTVPGSATGLSGIVTGV